GRRGRRLPQRGVQTQPALTEAVATPCQGAFETGTHRTRAHVITNPSQWPPPNCRLEPQRPQHLHTSRHKSFTAGFGPRKTGLVEEGDPQTRLAESKRQRGSGRTTPHDNDVAHEGLDS